MPRKIQFWSVLFYFILFYWCPYDNVLKGLKYYIRHQTGSLECQLCEILNLNILLRATDFILVLLSM